MSLVKNLAFVNNKWVPALSGKTFEVTNPANGNVLGQVPDMGTEDTEYAIKVAHDAFKTWEYTTAKVKNHSSVADLGVGGTGEAPVN